MASRKTLQEELYEEMRTSILTLELKPGERLKIEDWARKLEVSRTPIREVIQRLSSEGLIRMIPRVGPVVEEMNEKEVNDLYAVRMSLERLASKEAIEHFSPEDLTKLENIFKHTMEELSKGNARAIHQLNKRFHGTIYDVCTNATLKLYLRDIFTKLQRYLNLLSEEDAIRISATKHHERIYQCLGSRDLTGLLSAVTDHLIFSKEALIGILNSKYSNWLKRKTYE